MEGRELTIALLAPSTKVPCAGGIHLVYQRIATSPPVAPISLCHLALWVAPVEASTPWSQCGEDAEERLC